MIRVSKNNKPRSGRLLEPETVTLIRDLIAQKEDADRQEIADKFHISKSALYDIIERRTYKDVP